VWELTFAPEWSEEAIMFILHGAYFFFF